MIKRASCRLADWIVKECEATADDLRHALVRSREHEGLHTCRAPEDAAGRARRSLIVVLVLLSFLGHGFSEAVA